MKNFQEILENELYKGQEVDEGLIRNAISAAIINSLSSDELKDGLMDMYDYICDKADMKLFYQDFPAKYVPLWKNIYKMYEKGLIYIFDIGRKTMDQIEKEKEKEEAEREEAQKAGKTYKKKEEEKHFYDEEGMIEPDIQMRRTLRKAAKDSRVGDSNIEVSKVNKMVIFNGGDGEKFILSLNKVSGAFARLFKAVDVKIVETIMNKIAGGF